MTDNFERLMREQQALIGAIKHNSNRLTLPILKVLLKTFIVPFIAFFGLGLLRELAMGYAAQTFADPAMNTMTAFSTMLLVLAGTWLAWRWSEQRFGGASLIRQMGQVTVTVARLESEIERAQAAGSTDSETVERLSQLAQAAWNTYTQAMQMAGLDIPENTEPA